MDHKNMLTIGKLAKISGVHVKALRYYERIGILPPSYVNSENGYRYYSQVHIYLVETIRLCAELSIPLKELKKYISEDTFTISMQEIIETGIQLANHKMRQFQNNLDFLEEIKQEIQRSDRLFQAKEDQRITIPDKDYWVIPFEENFDEDSYDYHQLLNETYGKVLELGLRPVYEMGALLRYSGGDYRSYLFLTLEKNQQNHLYENTLTLPETTYVSKLTDTNRPQLAEELFPELFSLEYDKVVFKLDIMTSQFDVRSPLFEVRCSLPAED
ncbi:MULTISPECIES: MerR family transcriptional regulator [Enterococcus]|uniref:HTH merR-type domain-containing protein n=1 Tax=Candidatus Enterococcus ferrettii TaxID=2815324 RepID=A0ABV0EQ41_9ENTE|nr:MerR family transcriptional regulator [Enterococcus sp. 665A]MBO1341159.1 MerR family transcriptional regulator [Enterococcus sp. 665A]